MPLLDNADFVTIETAVVYNSAGLALTWNFVTCAGVVTGTAVTPTTAGVYDWSEPIADKGMYAIEIPASGGVSINNNTEGVGWFTGVATGVLPWRGPTIGFRRAALNDLLIEGSTASTNLEDFLDGTGYAGGTAKLNVNVASQDNIDFGATQKASIETACDASLGGGTGTALTSIPWNVAWDAEVQSEVDDALVAQRLDELLNADSDIDGVAPPTVGSVFHELLTKTAGSFTYDQSTDSLEAIRDTAPLGTAMRGTDSAALASVCTEARLAELDAANLITDVANVKTDTAAILVDTGTTLDGRLPAALISGKMDSNMRAATGTGAITSLTYELLIERIYEMINNKMNVTDSSGVVALRNIGNTANVATGSVADDSTTTVRNELTWV